MERSHCNFCNKEVGCKPPFFVGGVLWYEVHFTKEIDWTICNECTPKVVKSMKEIYSSMVLEVPKQ